MPVISNSPYFIPPPTGWDLSSLSYDSKSKDISAQSDSPHDVFFSSDGTKMYIIGVNPAPDSVYQYTLSTAWDVSTATYASLSFDLQTGTGETSFTGLYIKPDGTKMYAIGTFQDRVYQYTLSTPWNVSSASYDSVFEAIGGQEVTPYCVHFKPDGTKMYLAGITNDTVYQYTLSSPWVVSSATYDSVSKNVNSDAPNPSGIFFKDDGTKMYVVAGFSGAVAEYPLSTPWVVSSAGAAVTNSVSAQETSPQGIFIGNGGIQLYIVGSINGTVYQYTIS